MICLWLECVKLWFRFRSKDKRTQIVFEKFKLTYNETMDAGGHCATIAADLCSEWGEIPESIAKDKRWKHTHKITRSIRDRALFHLRLYLSLRPRQIIKAETVHFNRRLESAKIACDECKELMSMIPSGECLLARILKDGNVTETAPPAEINMPLIYKDDGDGNI